jgi:hypothetical protein
MSLATQIASIFQRAWQAYGQPVVTVVRPPSTWALPAGFAYDQTYDAIQNSAGVVLPNPQAYWVTDTVYLVPTKRTADLDVLIAAGVVPAGTVDIYVLAADVATMQAAHACQINGDWYDVKDVGQAPVGYPGGALGIWARVRLQRRS